MCITLKPINKSSSETIRKATFNFDAYYEFKPSHIKNIDVMFLIWFIGFVEGDGCFYSDKKANRNYFLISQKDPKILYLIKKTLGFGRVYQKDISYQYYVSDKNNIDKLIKIFNGNLQLNKTNKRFAEWLNIFNIKATHDSSISLIQLTDSKISLNNSWISGFIDAEGCFTATLRKDSRYKSGYKLVLRFILDQKNENKTLLEIGKLLGKEKLDSRQEIVGMNRLILYSNFNVLLNYLSKFPLKTIKNLSFLRWKRLFFYTKQENLLPIVQNEKAFIKLQKLIKSLNTHNIEKLKIESG